MEKIVNIDELKPLGYNLMRISRLVKKGKLGNLGYGFYTNNPNLFRLNKDETIIKINELLDSFPISPKRVIYSSSSLNPYINQLISSTTYIVEVEKEYVQMVFTLLKEEYKGNVLLKPNRFEKNNYWNPNIIYVKELFKRSPVNEDGTITIEKLVVDLLTDEDIYSLYSGVDIDSAIDILLKNYLINYKTLISYASRKNRKQQLLERIRQYIPQEILKEIEK